MPTHQEITTHYPPTQYTSKEKNTPDGKKLTPTQMILVLSIFMPLIKQRSLPEQFFKPQKLLPPATETNPESPQQVESEGDPMIDVVNFILREVLPIESQEDQLRLLEYYFGAILSESKQTPFTALAYEIIASESDHTITFNDDIYQLRPDLATICQAAITGAKNNNEKNRFQLESDQITRLQDKIKILLATGFPPQSIAHELRRFLKKNEKTLTNKPTHLIDQGWQPASGLISASVAQKMNITFPPPQYLAGPKYIYIMPQSKIHKGDLSLYVIAQPVYIPALKRFILLHDQQMIDAPWENHINLLKRLDVTIPPQFQKTPQLYGTQKQNLEKFVMKQLIELPKFQLLSATQTFLELQTTSSATTKIKQVITSLRLKRMKKSLKNYSQLVLDIFDHEQNLTATDSADSQTSKTPSTPLSPTQIDQIKMALTRIVTLGIVHEKTISSRMKNSLLKFYKKNKELDEESFAKKIAKRLGFFPALRGFDASIVECLTIGAVKGFKITPNGAVIHPILGKISPEKLSRKNISDIIGHKRAKDWTPNAQCTKCSTSNTWIGECGWCITCELGYGQEQNNTLAAGAAAASLANKKRTTSKDTHSHKSKTKSIDNQSTKSQSAKNHSISFSDFLAGVSY